MKYIIVIPARYESSRFNGKPLVDILGKSMIQRVYEQCAKAVERNLIYIATDDLRIKDAAEKFGANVVMTNSDCLTGTDRVAEVMESIEADYYINVQGDEPVFNPEDITAVIETLKKYPTEIINGYCNITTKEDYYSVSVPKVVFRPDGRLLYMSRSPIPGNKKNKFVKAWRQVCIYSFPKKSLVNFVANKTKTTLENEEDIEILRFLELGFEVRMVKLSEDSIAVDFKEDLKKVIKKIKDEPNKF